MEEADAPMCVPCASEISIVVETARFSQLARREKEAALLARSRSAKRRRAQEGFGRPVEGRNSYAVASLSIRFCAVDDDAGDDGLDQGMWFRLATETRLALQIPARKGEVGQPLFRPVDCRSAGWLRFTHT